MARLTDNHVGEGEIVQLPAPYARGIGEGALIGSIFGVACRTLANGEVGPFALEGVWKVAKKTADSFSPGTLCYWDDANKEITTTSTSNRRVGFAVETIGAVAGTVTMRLSGVPAPAGA